MKGRTDKRTTVSLAKVVWEMAEAMMKEKGFNENFSAYIADLIRRDKERHDAAREQKKPLPLYPALQPQGDALNEPGPKKKRAT